MHCESDRHFDPKVWDDIQDWKLVEYEVEF